MARKLSSREARRIAKLRTPITSREARRMAKLRTPISSEQARAMNADRKNTRNAGRPLSNQPRCPCGMMTLKRAKARGHRC